MSHYGPPSSVTGVALPYIKASSNRLLKIFGIAKELVGGWRNLHNEELHHNLHSLSNNY
jgi:hypothetical protein